MQHKQGCNMEGRHTVSKMASECLQNWTGTLMDTIKCHRDAHRASGCQANPVPGRIGAGDESLMTPNKTFMGWWHDQLAVLTSQCGGFEAQYQADFRAVMNRR